MLASSNEEKGKQITKEWKMRVIGTKKTMLTLLRSNSKAH